MKEWLDIGGEANLPTWWNATLLVLIALLWFTVGIMTEEATETGVRLRNRGPLLDQFAIDRSGQRLTTGTRA